MSHRSSTLSRGAASSTRFTTMSRHERLRQRREQVLTLVFWALALVALLAGLLAQTDAPSAPEPAPSTPAPAVSAPAAQVPTTAAQPGQQAQPPAPQPAQQPAQPSAQRSYQVRPGDTLAQVALRHGVDYQRIAADNRLIDPNRIRPGQTLRIGAPTPAVRLIAPGDTLTGLATATGLSVHELRVLNPWIAHPERIPAGAGLRVRR